MPRQSKAELDEQEELAEAQADLEAQVDAELAVWDAIAYGHIPGLSSFGFSEDGDDYAAYVSPSYRLSTKNEQDMACSEEDWQAFLKKIEEDLE